MQDTTPEAREIQATVYQRMDCERRLMTALYLSETVRELARSRIRRDHPDFGERAVEDQSLWELYWFRRDR